MLVIIQLEKESSDLLNNNSLLSTHVCDPISTLMDILNMLDDATKNALKHILTNQVSDICKTFADTLCELVSKDTVLEKDLVDAKRLLDIFPVDMEGTLLF